MLGNNVIFEIDRMEDSKNVQSYVYDDQWDKNATSHTKVFMTKLFDALSHDRARRIQNAKRRISNPITKKYEEFRLEQSIGKGLANVFQEGNDGSDEYLWKFYQRFGIYDGKFSHKYHRIVFPRVVISQLPQNSNQMDIIKGLK
jgi:hypothetical protein